MSRKPSESLMKALAVLSMVGPEFLNELDKPEKPSWRGARSSVDELRAFAKLRTRREAQWERLFAYDYHDDRFSYYAETKRETLAHYAGLRRQQKRDGLLKRFPGAGRAFEASLRALSVKVVSP